MSEPSKPRPRPCSSCPYRRDVPSGVWSAEEYVRLPRWDLPIVLQPPGAFYCHAGDGHLCSGWVGYRDPADFLGVRIGIASGFIDPCVLDYATDVPLFASGQEACDHGLRDVDDPSLEARIVVDKIIRKREAEPRA